jgi:RimJ/RimL family protein N-acetyltransferase
MHTVAPTLTTDRLVLRAHRLEDFAPIAALFETDRSRYMDGPRKPAEVWRGFAGDVGQWPLLGYGAWAITLRDGTYVGQVGLNRPLDFPEDELGWLVFDGYEGRGYAYEAAVAARDFAFGAAGLKTLVSYIDPDNTRSLRLAERLGAVRDPSAATPNGDPCLVYRHPNPRAK